MTQKYAVFGAPLKIRYKGMFDWGGLYRLVHTWMMKRKYRFHEKRYKDKIDTALGNEIEVTLWGEKEVTEYYKFKVTVDFHLWESKEVPVVENGEKKMKMRGRMHVEINGEVIADWQGRFKGKKLYELMEKFLNDVVMKKEREMKYIDVMDKGLHRLEGDIKGFLGMEADPSAVG